MSKKESTEIGELLLAHKKTQATLDHYETQIDTLRGNFEVVSRALGEKREVLRSGNGASLSVRERPGGVYANSVSWPSVEDIDNLSRGRSETKKKLDDLTQKLRKLGMGDYLSRLD